MKVMGSSSSSSSLFPIIGSSSSSVHIHQNGKGFANGSNGISHSKRRKLLQQQKETLPSSHRWHVSFTLTITGLVVTALFFNVVLVHVQLFNDYSGVKRKGALTMSEMNTLDVENALGSGIGESNNYNNPKDSIFNAAAGSTYLNDVLASFGGEGNQATTNETTTNPKGSSSYNSFSACMLIKDDNDLLNEWLAYHYHVLNLRYLVVAVDPSSATSPTPIFEKWRRLTDLKIAEWSDKDFMPAVFLLTGYHISPNLIDGDANKSKFHEGTEEEEKVKADNLIITNHRFRQITFLEKCLKHMRNHKKAWTMHIDTDEFVVINPLLRNTTQQNVKMIQIPPIEEKGSIANVVNQYFNDETLKAKFNYPCISMPRLLFGSVEIQENTTYPEEVLKYFNVSMLETIRWQYHTDYGDKDRNAQPKVIIDVSVVPRSNDMFNKPFSIHRPSKNLCRRIAQLDFKQLQRYPITVNHYTGSWERYFSKSDTRRSERAYNLKAHVAAGHDTYMAPWLMGFVNHVGFDLAKELLDDYLLEAASPAVSAV